LQLFPANGKQELAALTYNKQENVDQMQADNVIKHSGARINHEKYCKNICLPKQGHQKNLKTYRNPYLGLDL